MSLEQIKVDLVDSMGSDTRVVDAARVSFDKQSDGSDPEGDAKLIKYLATHDHFTPFTHCSITLRETVPIFVARQRFKHTVGFTYNETSRRYVDGTPEFFVPDEWRERPEGSVKQGSGQGFVTTVPDHYGHPRNIDSAVDDLYTHAEDLYRAMLDANVAPEMARMVLPQAMMTSYYVTGSLMAFARAYKLRSDTHSQLESQHLAQHWDTVIRPLFPVSWAALVGTKEES
jgi:thymidylate synthase (FAD)